MLDSKQKVFFVKGSSGARPRRLDALRLRHPRSGLPAAFLLDAGGDETDNGRLLEVQVIDSGHRSWLVGSHIEPDGQAHVCTPFDPLFLVLPHIQKSQYAQQLGQILEDHEFPDTARLSAVVSTDRFSLIAERKGDADLQAYKYSEQRTLAWLERKARRLATVLEARGIHGNTGKSDNFVKVGDEEVEKDAYLKFAWGITSEYLSSGLSATLRRHLELPDERPKRSEPAQEQPASKRPRGAPLAPIEDYSASTPKNKQASAPQNAKQKALAKSAVGSKNIMSFFKKK